MDPAGRTFSEDDLAPSADERRLRRTVVIDKISAACASVATGLVVGGLIALGACAAPAVFGRVPAPLSGDAMGNAFARYDRVAIGAAAVIVGAELVRTFVARRLRPDRVARGRRIASILLAGFVSVMALSITPTINALHQAGVKRGEGEAGQRLADVHARAELFGKLEAALGLLVIALHIASLKSAAELADAEAAAQPGPAPPGPSR